ncbi:MAG TPA: glycosyltransferase family 1 protein [Flavobacteriales bacterium]|nr:glycosyltransferase family 1 protein [Flavobacteriales bacterium]
MKFIKWNRETEIDDLMKFDIGLMPIINDTWANGKCGFKAIQYMALGIPAVVSPIVGNPQLVDDMIDGLICNTLKDWREKLTLIMEDKMLLQKLSMNTRDNIVKRYSVNSNKDNFLSLFEL